MKTLQEAVMLQLQPLTQIQVNSAICCPSCNFTLSPQLWPISQYSGNGWRRNFATTGKINLVHLVYLFLWFMFASFFLDCFLLSFSKLVLSSSCTDRDGDPLVSPRSYCYNRRLCRFKHTWFILFFILLVFGVQLYFYSFFFWDWSEWRERVR